MRPVNKIEEYAVYAFFFSLNFETMNLLNLDIDYLFSKITISILIFFSILRFNSFFSLKKFFIYLIPLFAYFILLTIISYINRSLSQRLFFDFLFFLNISIFLILINYSRIKPDILLKGLYTFALSGFILSILFFLGAKQVEILEGRFTIYGMNANFLGVSLCISLFTLISIIFENRLKLGKGRYFLTLTFPILLLFMIKTGSRVALISFGLGIFIFILFNKTIKSIQKIFLIILAFLISSLFFLQKSVVVERLLETINGGDLAHRDKIWGLLLTIFSNKLIWGVGKTGYLTIAGDISPHNVILEVFLYTGLVGLFVFLIFLFAILNNANRRRKYEGEILPVVLFIPILGIILSGQIFDHKFIWVVFAYLASNSINKINKSQINAYDENRND